MKTTTVSLEDKLWERLKILSVKEGKTISQIMRNSLETYLKLKDQKYSREYLKLFLKMLIDLKEDYKDYRTRRTKKGRPEKIKEGKKRVNTEIDSKVWKEVKRLAMEENKKTGEILEEALIFYLKLIKIEKVEK